MRSGETYDRKGDGCVCPRHWTQSAGAQRRPRPLRSPSRRARRQAQVRSRRL